MENLLTQFNFDGLLLSGGLILGILICLFGLKFQKFIIAIIGCVVGFTLGNIIINLIGVDNQSLSLVIKFGLALVVGACSFSLFESLIAILVGAGIFILISDMIGTVWYSYLVGAIFGIIGGGLVSKYYKLGVVIFTSFVGAYLVTNGVCNYLNYSYLMILGVVFIISLLFQFLTNKIKI